MSEQRLSDPEASRNPMVAIAEQVRAAMIDCLEKREDGRFYATETGCARLRAILQHHGIDAEVSIGADERFQIRVPQKSQAHTCHWPGCQSHVPPAMWGCKKHWFALPKALRDRVWATYRPGQEITKTPSDAYLKVAQDVQQWIKESGK